MSVNATVLFGQPQKEIFSSISKRLSNAVSSTIVTGFATPGGLNAISGPIRARPGSIANIIIGAATYPGFEALDELNAAGVALSKLFVHLGHTRPSGTPKKPTVRFHPMLHSKIYYMEFPDGTACAFIGSHNMTSFALTGLNGEAGVLLEGPVDSSEFQKVREHIDEARRQSVPYTPGMKESLAWWSREFIDGMRSEVKLPIDWIIVRTILIFAQTGKKDRPRTGEQIYFEIPAGIEQIESLKTEMHLFLFETLPSDPWQALQTALSTNACFTCKTSGAENRQGNLEVIANWQIEGSRSPILKRVPSGVLRPNTSTGMQQVRAEVIRAGVTAFEYLFDREKKEWDPVYANEDPIRASRGDKTVGSRQMPDLDDRTPSRGWELVHGLIAREKQEERDVLALKLAAPESGSFVLVSLRRRPKKQPKPSDPDLFR